MNLRRESFSARSLLLADAQRGKVGLLAAVQGHGLHVDAQDVHQMGAVLLVEVLLIRDVGKVVGEDFAVVSAKVFFSIVARSSFFMAGLRANP